MVGHWKRERYIEGNEKRRNMNPLMMERVRGSSSSSSV